MKIGLGGEYALVAALRRRHHGRALPPTRPKKRVSSGLTNTNNRVISVNLKPFSGRLGKERLPRRQGGRPRSPRRSRRGRARISVEFICLGGANKRRPEKGFKLTDVVF